jgi:hypothetical protein
MTDAKPNAATVAANEIALTLAQLRHAYEQLAAGTVEDQVRFANGLIAPAIRRLERIIQ